MGDVIAGGLLLAGTVVVGAAGILALQQRRRFWTAALLSAAFVTLILTIVLGVFNSSAEASVVAAYATTCGLSILAVALAMTLRDVRAKTRGAPPLSILVFAAVLALAVPPINAGGGSRHLWFAAIATGTAMLSLALYPAFVYAVSSRRQRVRRLGTKKRGTDAPEHIFFYVPVTALLVVHGLCPVSPTALAIGLFVAFVGATAGAAGVARRADAWK